MDRSISSRRRWFFIALYPVYLIGIGWLGVQFFWWMQEKKTGQTQTDVWTYYYPKLRAVRDAEIPKDDDTFDVLLLGGSVLEQVAPVLEKALKTEFARPVRVFSVSTSAHTSRDSFLKFTQLEKPFDLVVIYHGINEARMNCVPEELFQDDYTHCHHYYSLKRAVEAGRLTIGGLVRDRVDRLIALGEPAPELVEFGKTIKTRKAFRQNLEDILRSARSRSSRVLLMTFAHWVPADYSKDRFEAKQLGYGPGQYELPIEVWGKPEYVVAAIQAHNREIERLAKDHEVLFVDQAHLMAGGGAHFSDICHLTETGCQQFVAHMLPVVKTLE